MDSSRGSGGSGAEGSAGDLPRAPGSGAPPGPVLLESQVPASGAAWVRTTTGDFVLTPVYRRVGPDLRNEAVAFWFEHRLVGEACVAERRSWELVCLARAADGRLAGMATASLGRRTQEGRSVYDLRLFLAPACRGTRLAGDLLLAAREHLRADSAHHPAAGVRLVAEHPKLARPGIGRWLARHGFAPRGRDRQGRGLWFAPFD